MVETPEESLKTIEDMFEKFDEEDLAWKKKHPLRGYIRDWLDKHFSKGIAGYRAYYSLQRPWKILRYCRDEIEHAWQRVFRGWDDTAPWHVGYYLAETLPGIIRQLKNIRHGVPLIMYEGVEEDPLHQMELGGIDEDGNFIETEEDKAASEKWDKILDEIADGLESYLKYDQNYDGKIPYKENEDYQKFQRALDLLKEYFEDLWD